MATRTRKTPDQVFNHHMRLAQAAKARGKKLEKANRTQQAIIAGETIRAMAAAGDRDAERAWDKMLDGLKRKQDRLAFGLEPLPEPGTDNPPAENPQPSDLLDAQIRLDRAVKAWTEKGVDRAGWEPLRVEFRDAVVAFERLSRVCSSAVSQQDRAYFDLTDRPGELVKAA